MMPVCKTQIHCCETTNRAFRLPQVTALRLYLVLHVQFGSLNETHLSQVSYLSKLLPAIAPRHNYWLHVLVWPPPSTIRVIRRSVCTLANGSIGRVTSSTVNISIRRLLPKLVTNTPTRFVSLQQYRYVYLTTT